MKKYFFLIIILLSQKCTKAQTDTAFWLAAPDILEFNHPIYGQYDRPIYLRLTSFTSSASVTISIPANPLFTPININIPANSTSTVNLTTWIDMIENFEPDNINNKGIYIRSTTGITAYYEVNSITCDCNPEFFSLKGRNALGNEFYVPTQVTWSVDTVRHPGAKAGFVIVATQNNTSITITPTKPLIGRAANVPFTITLDRGQSYACIGLYRNGPSMLNGSKVVSDKPLAVTEYEDLLFSDGACADLAGDQLIPTSIFGTEFAVVRGNLTVRDKVIITASQNTTNVYFNGNATAVATINSGQSYEYDMTPAILSLYIVTDKAASVYHYTGSGCEVGSGIIPKLNCTGSSSVSLVKSNNGTAMVMLVTKNGNQGNFLVNGAGGIITAGNFAPLPGTGGTYVYAKKDVSSSMPLNAATTFSNTSGKFQLGFFNESASTGGCMYGFFSDFKKSNVTNSQEEICRFDSVQLNATGGITYQWTPVTGLSNPNIGNPKASPAVTTDYTVIITDSDGCIDSAFVKVIVNTCTTNSSLMINDYTPVLGLNICENKLTVEDATSFNIGDTVLLIQMKGAIIDSTNTAAFGSIMDYKNSGNYEFNYVKSKSGNSIELKNALTRQYDIPAGKVQLIRVPYYTDLVSSDTLTCLPWDGSKGGVLVFNVLNILTLNENIDVSGRGFKGAAGYNPGNATLTCFENNYNYPINSLLAAQKGESITSISNNIICGKGNPAAGGGGGLGHNSGGGGGGNAGAGGFGGYQLEPCGSAPFDNRGIGGRQLAYNTATNKIFMGSGGGAGHADNPGNIPPAGGNGGGIVIISADKIQANAKKIIANGAAATPCSIPSSPDCHDGMGGGGAGGTVLLSVNQFLDNSILETKGGNGANMVGSVSIGGRIGAGGGGGGGLTFIKSAALPGNLNVVNTGGVNGVLTQDGNNSWGATSGSTGSNLFNLIVPVDLVPFQKNIDSVRIKDSLLNCNGFDFKGLAYIHSSPIVTWQWYFGDGGTANTQNTSHAYNTAGTYTVRIIITDINGCIDSTSIDVNALPGVNAEAGSDTSICTNTSVSVMLNGTAVGGPYLWSPAAYLDNPNIQNPTATVSTTTTFYLNVTSATSCTSIDSVTIYINPLPLVNTIGDTAICRFSALVLTTNSNAANYQWSPAIYVSDPAIASPNYIDNFSHTLYITGTSGAGCTSIDSVNVTVNSLPVVQTINDTTLCSLQAITLTTTGAQTYSWSPATGLSNPTIANPVFAGSTGQTYTVTGTDANSCKNTDVVTIYINSPDSLKSPPSFSICQQQSVQLDGNNGTRVSYLWSPATYLSNSTIINPWANPPTTTVYTLLVTDNMCGFDSTFTSQVTVLPAPLINVHKSNDIDCANHTSTLFASGGDQYIWSPSTGLSSTTIANPVATVANTQTYYVQVINPAGCSNTDSVTVFVKNVASLARYMPNAFTPNGDGINDCYGLKSWMYVQQLQFYIFNRYGEQVFATANPNTCWDGTYKGKPALAGAYVYVIRAKTACGLEEQKGNFILIR